MYPHLPIGAVKGSASRALDDYIQHAEAMMAAGQLPRKVLELHPRHVGTKLSCDASERLGSLHKIKSYSAGTVTAGCAAPRDTRALGECSTPTLAALNQCPATLHLAAPAPSTDDTLERIERYQALLTECALAMHDSGGSTHQHPAVVHSWVAAAPPRPACTPPLPADETPEPPIDTGAALRKVDDARHKLMKHARSLRDSGRRQ